MLRNQQALSFSNYSGLYDIIVPKDNKFRLLNELVDFSFILDELKSKYCLDNGRMAEDPIRMFKYLLIKCISGLSDVDVVDKCRYDMSYKYFLGLTPEGTVIESSTLCKFRRIRLKDTDLLNLLIDKTIEIAKEHGIKLSNRVIVDSTHSLARSTPLIQTKELKRHVQLLRKTALEFNPELKDKLPENYEGDNLETEMDYVTKFIETIKTDPVYNTIPAVSEKTNLLEEITEDIKDHYTISVDPDARIGHKSKSSEFYGYKTHLAVTPEQLIVAATVTSGEKHDGRELDKLISKTKKNIPELSEVIGDGAYSSLDNLRNAKKEGVTIVATLNKTLYSKKEDHYTFNKDAGMAVCPAGHMAIKKSNVSRNENTKENGGIIYFFDIGKCRVCKHNDLCGYKKGNETKTHKITKLEALQMKQLKYQGSENFKKKYKERYIVEAKNSDLKNNYGMSRADGYGLESFRMQGAISIFSSNMMRILRLLAK